MSRDARTIRVVESWKEAKVREVIEDGTRKGGGEAEEDDRKWGCLRVDDGHNGGLELLALYSSGYICILCTEAGGRRAKAPPLLAASQAQSRPPRRLTCSRPIQP